MQHIGTQTIETERLILRPFRAADAPAMFRNWASDPAVTQYVTWPTHQSPEETAGIVEAWVRQTEADPSFYQWAIELKGLGEPIGSIAVAHLDEKTESAELGWCIGRAWWHRGYTSVALRAVMDFFFDTVGVNRVESEHDPENPHSGMVMRKCCMKYEGTLRQAVRSNRGVCDACWYALLRGER